MPYMGATTTQTFHERNAPSFTCRQTFQTLQVSPGGPFSKRDPSTCNLGDVGARLQCRSLAIGLST